VNYPPPRREPSPGVLAAAIVLLLYGILIVVAAVELPLIVLRLHPDPGEHARVIRGVTLPVLRELVVAFGMIATSYGLFRLRRWSRVSILSMSAGMIGFGFYLWIGAYVTLPNHGLTARWPLTDSPLGVIFVFFLALTIPGVWWLGFFLRHEVKAQFAAAARPENTEGEANP
jgi:hypothetical protein